MSAMNVSYMSCFKSTMGRRVILLCSALAVISSLHAGKYRPVIDSQLFRTPTGPVVLREKDADKPTFVLHLGPHKTGTTYLQSVFSRFHTHPAWKLDNLTYMGTYMAISRSSTPSFGPWHSLNVIFKSNPRKRGYLFDEQIDNTLQNCTMQETFSRSIEELRQMNTNVLFVYEDLARLDPRTIEALHDVLTPHWNVRTIVTYRPLHDFLISWYNQIEKSKIANWSLPGERNSMAAYDIVPEDVDNYDVMAADTARMFNEFASKGKHPIKVLSDMFEPFFGAATIMRPATPSVPTICDPLLDALLCKSIHNAPHLCQACQAGEFAFNAVSNPSMALNYDKLAVAANGRGWIPLGMSRTKAYETIERFQQARNMSQYDFPLLCMSQEKLDRLELTSRVLEEHLFGGNIDADAFHARFVAANQSFCSIDLDLTLDDLEWRNFFLLNMTI